MFNHHIDPVAFNVGPLSIHWYGLMWAMALLTILQFLKYRDSFQEDHLDSLLTSLLLGTILGAKIGYALFYSAPEQWLKLFFQRSGFSFHGGLVGLSAALYCWCSYHQQCFWQTADKVALSIPWGLFWGRIGNFLNSELYGYPSDLPWAVIFHHSDVLKLPRHPSQLYEALAEGVLLGLFLLWLNKKKLSAGQIGVAFIAGYGLARFVVEFFRLPDLHLGLIYYLSRGQWLCLLMMMVALAISYFLSSKKTLRQEK